MKKFLEKILRQAESNIECFYAAYEERYHYDEPRILYNYIRCIHDFQMLLGSYNHVYPSEFKDGVLQRFQRIMQFSLHVWHKRVFEFESDLYTRMDKANDGLPF